MQIFDDSILSRIQRLSLVFYYQNQSLNLCLSKKLQQIFLDAFWTPNQASNIVILSNTSLKNQLLQQFESATPPKQLLVRFWVALAPQMRATQGSCEVPWP